MCWTARKLIEALIFDFDGLIIDTETPEFDSWQEVFQSYGVALERRLWEGFIGSGFGSFDVCEHLSNLCGQPIDPDAVRRRQRPLYLERIERNPVLPGVEDYILTAKDMGLKLAVASSSRGGWASSHLARRGLLCHFEFVLSGDDVANVKPDPELYAKASQLLGVLPQNSLAIEDSANGLKAANAAGLRCVVVPNPMTKGMQFATADFQLEALSDIPLHSLLANLRR